MALFDLAITWLRIGTFGFGGGPAMIPLMQAECVQGRGWLTDQQFLDGLAAGSALPGPISAKMSVYVGMAVGGPAGAAGSLMGVMLPGVILMSVLATVLLRFRDNPAVSGAMSAVQPVVIGLLAWTAISLIPDGIRGGGGAVLAIGAVIAMALKVHPAIVIVVAMGVGAVWMR